MSIYIEDVVAIRIDEDKIRLMTKLAVYDKNYRIADEEKISYFQFDYAYKNNFWTRLSVTVGFLFLVLFYVGHKVFIENIDIFTLDFKAEGLKIGMAYLYVIIVYTVIGSVISNIEYLAAEKRQRRYYKIADELSGVDESPITKKSKLKKSNSDIETDHSADDTNDLDEDELPDDYPRRRVAPNTTYQRTRGDGYAVRNSRYTNKPNQKR